MEPTQEPDVFGIVANVLSDKHLRIGGKVWIQQTNGGAEMVKVSGLSHGGRRIYKYVPLKRLSNFRAKWIPETQRKRNGLTFSDKEKAEAFAQSWCEMWKGIRFYDANGVLLKDGESASHAFSNQE
jgi:hypothetical protein